MMFFEPFSVLLYLQLYTCSPVKNRTGLDLIPTTEPWYQEISPVVGRIKWCVNETRQQWEHSVNLSAGQMELSLKQSGKFRCPEKNHTADMAYCCGDLGAQYCCKFTDTPGLKWGVAVGVIVTFIVFLTVSYTIQFFRVCDRCYHECPTFGFELENQEFQLDTRWYTVSHEGNRYGVTFHSRVFAKEFMDCLEAKYGRWNTANILKIQRDGQDFVILNIFFHDVFTPWFYTQGPIKNDEEWIRTDFKAMCQSVKSKLTVKTCLRLRQFCKCNREAQTQDADNKTDRNQDTTSLDPSKTDSLLPTHSQDRSNFKGMHKWVPWTKAVYANPTDTDETFASRSLKRSSTRAKNHRKMDKCDVHSPVSVIIFEDLIECNGLEKGIQTRQKHVRAKLDKVTVAVE